MPASEMAEWVNDVSPEDDSQDTERPTPDSVRIGRFMRAERVPVDPHDAYTVHARNGETIGLVEWYPRWKEYVFLPDDRSALSHQCLRDMAMFLCKAESNRP